MDSQEQGQAAKVAFFFKDWGGKKKKAGRELKGQTNDEMPEVELENYS